MTLDTLALPLIEFTREHHAAIRALALVMLAAGAIAAVAYAASGVRT